MMYRVALTLASALMSVAVVSAAPKTPNILWIMLDDLGYGEIGAFPCTSPHGRIATPNLDKFASEGMRFVDAYAGYTVCAPSRTGLFTGRHSGQYVKHGLSGTSLTLDQTAGKNTTAQLLQQAGYKTAAFGKTAPLVDPVSQGFDTFQGQVNQGYCHNMYPHFIDSQHQQLNVNLTGNWKPKSRATTMSDPSAFNYTIDIFYGNSRDWINQHVTSDPDTPFFVYTSFTVPHAGGWGNAPNQPEQGNPVPSDLQYANENWPDVERDHAAVITYVDGLIGDLLKELEDLGVADDTVVFVASDNGAQKEGGHSNLFFNSTGGLSGQKRSLYEGGMRSPSMIRWPGVVPAGSTSTHQWAFMDVLPTMMDIAGTPSKTPAGIDGISIYPTLTGKGKQEEHTYLYFTWNGLGYPAPSNDPYGYDAETFPETLYLPRDEPVDSFQVGGTKSGYVVRVGNWTGLVPYCADTKNMQPSMGDEMYLFNLASDPFQKTDVSKANPDVVEMLKKTVIPQDLTCHCYQC